MFRKMNLGNYPREYDPAIHGPYDPAQYYGKPDTPFGQVKLKDLSAWLGRRDKSPVAMTQACSRAYWRWNHKYVQPVRSGMASVLHIAVGGAIVFYILNYQRIRGHAHYKYH